MGIRLPPDLTLPRNGVQSLDMQTVPDEVLSIPIAAEIKAIVGFRCAVNDDVAAEGHIVPAVQKESRLATFKNIIDDRAFSEIIVAIDGENTNVILFTAHNIVEIIVSDNRALHGVVPAGIDRRGIVTRLADVEDLVIFDDMIVARKVDRHMRGIVNAVAAAEVADTVKGKSGLIGGEDLRKMMKLILFECENAPRRPPLNI